MKTYNFERRRGEEFEIESIELTDTFDIDFDFDGEEAPESEEFPHTAMIVKLTNGTNLVVYGGGGSLENSTFRVFRGKEAK